MYLNAYFSGKMLTRKINIEALMIKLGEVGGKLWGCQLR